jgi:hypothetical protein
MASASDAALDWYTAFDDRTREIMTTDPIDIVFPDSDGSDLPSLSAGQVTMKDRLAPTTAL